LDQPLDFVLPVDGEEKVKTIDATNPQIIQEGSNEQEQSKTQSVNQSNSIETGKLLVIAEPITRTLSNEEDENPIPFKNEDVINLSSDIAELTNIGNKVVRKKKMRSSSKPSTKGPVQMLSIKFNNAVIKISSGDLKSKKNLIGKNAEIIYNNEVLGRYQGKIYKGLPHGYGVKTWPGGKSYQGNWHRGKMHGNGELIITENESYTGEFKFGLPWGLGIRKWQNGDYFEGEYVKGYQQGSGLFISK
jgi:hypothetical protein